MILTYLFYRHEITGFVPGVTPSQIREQLQNIQENRPITDPAVKTLITRVRTVGALVQHSPQRKNLLRSRIFGVIAEYGWPTFFITLNPNDLYSPILKFRLGVLHEELDRNTYVRKSNLSNADSPVECAEYFNHVVKTFLQVLFGFDEESGNYQTSIFGNVVNHFGVVEEQQRKQLHLHMLVWVDGLTDYDAFSLKMKDALYMKGFIQYLNSLISASYSEPTVSNTYQDARDYLCPTLTKSNFDRIFKKEFQWVQEYCQIHVCSKYHCMKKKSSCRYGFPKTLCSETNYSCHLEQITIKRNNAFLNNANPIVSAVGRFNNDIQVCFTLKIFI